MHATAQSTGLAVDVGRATIMDGVVFVDRDGVITLLNPAAEQLMGVKGLIVLGKPIGVVASTSTAEGDELLQALVDDHVALAARDKASDPSRRGSPSLLPSRVERTVEVHRSDQDLVYIRLCTTTVRDHLGEAAGALTVIEDVTDHHKSDQLRNQYLSIVAHELRTPLTGIKTFSTMMARGTLGELTDKQQRVMDSIREQSLRLEHQIDKLINLGSLDAGDYGQDLQVLDLREFMLSVTSPFAQAASDRSVELVFDRAEVPEVAIAADRTDLRRAAQALVENAIKFAPEGGRVEVRVTPDEAGDGLRLMVSDNGPGIDPRYHRRIFEKFFQVEDPLTRHHGGAGLGLFVAQGIVEAHGSQVHVDSDLGRGATFWFCLPLHRPNADDRPLDPVSSPSTPTA